MNKSRSGRTRLMLGLGAFVVSGLAITAAALTDSATVVVSLDGSQNRFDIDVAGNYSETASAWVPTDSDWRQGNPDAYDISVGPGKDNVLSPGAAIDGRIAVRNNSPRLAGLLSLTILDPEPRGVETDPTTGNFVELFDQLIFTVKDGDTTLLDRVPANALEAYTWGAALPAGENHVLDVRIEMADTADNRWQLASTDIQFHFAAVTP